MPIPRQRRLQARSPVSPQDPLLTAPTFLWRQQALVANDRHKMREAAEANCCFRHGNSFTALSDSLQLELQFRSSHVVTHHLAAGINEHHRR